MKRTRILPYLGPTAPPFLSLWLYSYFPSKVSPLSSVPRDRDIACASQNQAVLPRVESEFTTTPTCSQVHPTISSGSLNLFLHPLQLSPHLLCPAFLDMPLHPSHPHGSSHYPSTRLPNLRRHLLFNWRIPGSGPYSLVDSPSSEEAQEKA